MKKKYIILGIALTLLTVISASYAYFLANIKGEGKNISVTFGDVSIIFTDTDTLGNEEIVPGWSKSKTFTIENQGNTVFYYDINIKELINTFKTENYLQYKITSTNGYNMTEFQNLIKSETETIQEIGSYISIAAKTTQEYTITFRYLNDPDKDQSEDMDAIFTGKLAVEEAPNLDDPNLFYNKLLSDNPTHTGQRPNAFDGVYTTDNTGVMYVASGNQTEDGSNVYYFAGNAKNNWVKFGKNEQDEDLYWRIIRTNEDGSVRMLYAGTSPATTAGYINASQAYNPTYNNPMYVGYMYGSSGSLANNRTNTTNSPIKTVVDNWYASGLNTKTDASGNTFDKYISQTAIYCNDRANEGYSTSSSFNYAARYRLIDNKAPSYKCGNNASGSLYTGTNGVNVADKFSKNTSKGGNGKLQYPVALMTTDEISFAGGLWLTNAPAWYYYNSGTGSITGDKWWWTMSPYVFNGNSAVVFGVYGSSNPGRLSDTSVYFTGAIRPVISLKSCTTWKSGNGSSSTPYEVILSNTCAKKVN